MLRAPKGDGEMSKARCGNVSSWSSGLTDSLFFLFPGEVLRHLRHKCQQGPADKIPTVPGECRGAVSRMIQALIRRQRGILLGHLLRVAWVVIAAWPVRI